MNRTTIIVAVGLVLAAALPAAPAQALGFERTFVSGHGIDTGTCRLATPCRTFAYAITQTSAGGEINVLDPGGYGNVTIDKAISIVNDGGGEPGAHGNGITINAGANDAVSLRGLSLDGDGAAGPNGIVFNSGKSLTIANCIIRHFTNDGIDFSPNAAAKLVVSNTVVSDNGGNGIAIAPLGPGAVTASINRVETNNNSNFGVIVSGFNASGTVKVTVNDSVSAGNGGGYAANSLSGHAPTTLTLFRSVAADSFTSGVASETSLATVRLAQSVVTGNGAGWGIFTSGVIASYGDNYIDGNGSNIGSLTPVSRQ